MQIDRVVSACHRLRGCHFTCAHASSLPICSGAVRVTTYATANTTNIHMYIDDWGQPIPRTIVMSMGACMRQCSLIT